MYTRELSPAPDYPVLNGKPQFGSFIGPFGHFDIRGMKRPFGDLPLPVFITNIRIMERMRFLFSDDETIGEISIFNAGYFSFMETTLWNRTTKYKTAYRRILPPRLMRGSRNFLSSVTACRTQKRYVKINTRLQKKMIYADFDFVGSDSRPSTEAHLEMNLDRLGAADLSSLIPYGVKRRCQASYQVTGPVQGWISTGDKDHTISEEFGIGFLDVRKAYFSLRTKTSSLVGFARIDGNLISFQLGNSVSGDDYRYNDNILFYNGIKHPLPPVRITRPYGVSGAWVIQDTESMVDLIFTPISVSSRSLSLFVVRTSYQTVYGTFDGTLLTGEGEPLVLKAFPGIGKKILLRI